MTNLGIKQEILELVDSLEECPMNETDYFLETAAWYNGREKGVSISVKRKTNYSIVYIFVIAENRNSDEFVLYSWVPTNPYLVDPPTYKDMRDNTYTERKYFSVLRPAKMHIVKELYNL